MTYSLEPAPELKQFLFFGAVVLAVLPLNIWAFVELFVSSIF